MISKYLPSLCPVFSDGVYFAANAIADLALISDAPDCYMNKTTRISGSHDWFSTLARIPNPRHINTQLTIPVCSMGDTSSLEKALNQVGQDPAFSAIAVTASTMVEATHRDYDPIFEDAQDRYNKPVLPLVQGELQLDWLDGYGSMLSELAKRLPLPEAKPIPKTVAVIGYFMDRNESDHQANLQQIRLLLSMLGLTPGTIWFSGETCQELAQVAQAGILISLPYGRKAAQILARRTGSQVVEAPLPIGVEGCADFLRVVAEACNEQARAESIIETMEAEILPKLRIPVERYLLGKRFALMGDPYFIVALGEALRFFGAEIAATIATADKRHISADDQKEKYSSVKFDADFSDLINLLEIEYHLNQINALISPSFNTAHIKFPFAHIELGYHSYFTHHLLPMPFMGYDGVLGLVERIANALAHYEQMNPKT